MDFRAHSTLTVLRLTCYTGPLHLCLVLGMESIWSHSPVSGEGS